MSRRAGLDRLTTAINEYREAGTSVPCVDDPRDGLWISDDPEKQDAAARACLDCPALAACRSYVAQFPETGGTWGGRLSRATDVPSRERHGMTAEEVRARMHPRR